MIRFDPFQAMQQVVVVGCGGTGSHIARSTARMIFDLKRRRRHTPEVLFVDPDMVEANNVGRQMFTASDVGFYKAEMLATRFNLALGLDIRWSNTALDVDQHVQPGAIVMGAVDNHAGRAEMARAEGVIWADCGNHHQSGQVVIGNSCDIERIQRGLDGERCHYLPHAGLLFPELLLPPDVNTSTVAFDTSCAVAVETGSQMVLINDLMASVAAQYLYKLLHRQPITSFMTYIDADTLSVRSLPISRAELAPYLLGS